MLFFTDGGLETECEYICDCCANSFQTEQSRDNHINKCVMLDKQDNSILPTIMNYLTPISVVREMDFVFTEIPKPR